MTQFERKKAPYVFYGQTTSTCETCLRPVPAKIVVEDNEVFYLKRCREHGVQKTLVSSDFEYFKWCKEFQKPGDRPVKPQTPTDFGCPLDCGLCPDHEQHSCLALIEVNEVCNLECPVCFANSSPSETGTRTLAEIDRMLDALVESEGEADVLQISGGEPTLHPDILEIIARAKSRPIRHVMINTNGLRIAREKGFAKELAAFAPGFEVYLQFDSLDDAALRNLRGANLRRIRDEALANLEEAGLSTTLVVAVKKGVNDRELGAIIDHALSYSCVRGVTFQPVQDAGRNLDFDKRTNRMLLTDIRSGILEQSDLFEPKDIIPLPCNPETISIAYGLRNGRSVTPVTSLIPQAELIAAVPNAITFEKDSELRQKIVDLYSLSSGDLNTAERMQSLLCCLPEVPEIDGLGYANIFRVAIVQFLDRYNFCVGNVKRSCIHFVTPDGKIIPFDTYNMFYRDGLVDELRREVG